jgi:uncharacterized membrane protein YedE/YeeE
MTPIATPAPSKLREAGAVALGVVLGFSLSRIGFTSFADVNAMFTFADWRLYLVFAGAVALTGVGLLALRRDLGPRGKIDRAVIVGGVVFGAGWAVCGACPGAAFAQLGEGKLGALATIAGILLGSLAVKKLRATTTTNQSC